MLNASLLQEQHICWWGTVFHLHHECTKKFESVNSSLLNMKQLWILSFAIFSYHFYIISVIQI